MAQRHAVVIGGSLAGLSAGRVLSDFFERVTVIDRDTYPDGALERPGVPQSRHVHALLARGRQELERLFPGFDQLMCDQGAHELDFGLDFATLRVDGWAARESDWLRLFFASRNLLESVVRGLFRKLPNVTLIERTTVTGIDAVRTGHLRATSVQLCPLDGGAASRLEADLIVDASGRASKAPEWFRALGVEPPQESVVDSFSGYSSRWFKAPDPSRWPREWWWKGIWIDLKAPEHMLAGVLFPLEQGRWLVTLGGVAKHYPPSDEAEFMAALETLRSPVLAETVRLAEPISPVYSNRAMANRFRHYDRWQGRLDSFIAVGDAACAFNPVYGQGMTTGTVSATILADCLKKYGPLNPELARHFFRAQGRFQTSPWMLATGADFRFPETEGRRPAGGKLFSPYFDTLFQAGRDDLVLHRRVGEVLNMLKSPSAFFEPAIMARVARWAFRRKFSRGGDRARPIPAMPPSLIPVG
ncbi:MAG: 2-polyprenyl-6-methoxyphenol hydroxylase-like oxidoreductase [Deltaproteobacteria bacterium]|nr:2-polyprenyl-6-methoxyphenol hydroxylase-like oxidoreductase [Deltaproteobacteria bacterium]